MNRIVLLLLANPVFRRTGNRIRFFSLKPSRDQDESNDMRYSPIGSAVFELLDDTHTDRQTNKHPVALVYRIFRPSMFRTTPPKISQIQDVEQVKNLQG